MLPQRAESAAFADGIQDFGQQHEDEPQDAQQVAEEGSGWGNGACPKDDEGINGGDEDGRKKR